MSKLVSMGVWIKDGTQYDSASTQAYNSDAIIFAENASVAQKKTYPAASGSINSVVRLNYPSANEGQDHSLFVADALATIVSGSA